MFHMRAGDKECGRTYLVRHMVQGDGTFSGGNIVDFPAVAAVAVTGERTAQWFKGEFQRVAPYIADGKGKVNFVVEFSRGNLCLFHKSAFLLFLSVYYKGSRRFLQLKDYDFR